MTQFLTIIYIITDVSDIFIILKSLELNVLTIHESFTLMSMIV